MIELKHLKTLQAIRHYGSLSKASEKLFITQSAISHQIKRLEEYFSLSLFERKSQPLVFTAQGRQLLELADKVLPLIDKIEDAWKNKTSVIPLLLRISIDFHTNQDWLLPIIQQFSEKWSHVHIQSLMHQESPIALLKNQSIDFAMVSCTEYKTQEQMTYYPLFAYETVGILSLKHPGAYKNYLCSEDFEMYPLICYARRMHEQDVFRLYLDPAHIAPKLICVEYTHELIQKVSCCQGMAAIPYWLAYPYIEKGYVRAIRIGTEGIFSTLYAAVPTPIESEEHIQAFLQLLKKNAQKLFKTIEHNY